MAWWFAVLKVFGQTKLEAVTALLRVSLTLLVLFPCGSKCV